MTVFKCGRYWTMTVFNADDIEHNDDCRCYRATGEFSFWHYQTAGMNTTKITSVIIIIIIIIYMYFILFRSKSGMPDTRKARGNESHDLVVILHLCVLADQNFIRKRLDHPRIVRRAPVRFPSFGLIFSCRRMFYGLTQTYVSELYENTAYLSPLRVSQQWSVTKE